MQQQCLLLVIYSTPPEAIGTNCGAVQTIRMKGISEVGVGGKVQVRGMGAVSCCATTPHSQLSYLGPALHGSYHLRLP